jgi:hypothetical protein
MCHQGEWYCDYLIVIEGTHSAQITMQQTYEVQHIMLTPWFSGRTNNCHWSLVVRHTKKNDKFISIILTLATTLATHDHTHYPIHHYIHRA